MKRLFALTVVVFVLLGLTQIASAGPERYSGKEAKEMTQPMLEKACNWTGFYIGANVGYTGGDMTWRDDANQGNETGAPTTILDKNQSGFQAGGQLGYNYQIRSFVLGVEGSFLYSDARNSTTKNGETNSDNAETHNDWLGTAGGRVGYAWNHFLFYATGGAAFVHEKYSLKHFVPTSPGSEGEPAETVHTDSFNADEVRVAPMVGGGVEYAINCHWSARIEYTHLFLGDDSITGTNIDDGVPESETSVVDANQNAVRLGLNYKF